MSNDETGSALKRQPGSRLGGVLLVHMINLLLIPAILVMAWFEGAESPWARDRGQRSVAAVPAEKAAKKDKPAPPDKENPPAAKTATLQPEEIDGFRNLPAAMQEMLTYALSLTARGLSYKAGSADPDDGGTDCSGFVYHILQKHGHSAAPRQSNEMYAWTWQARTFRAVNGLTLGSFELEELRAGDLLFWVNSTKDGKTSREPPITHVMIYLGKRVSDGHPVVAGASDGRTYDGQRMSGVSVFDFVLPSPERPARFIGYAHLPSPPEAKPAAPKVELKKGAKKKD